MDAPSENSYVSFKKKTPLVKSPVQTTRSSVGYDVYSLETKFINPHCIENFKTGLYLTNIDPNIFIQIHSRSGLVYNHGLITVAGTIDPDYRGEISVLLLNTSNEQKRIEVGDRIAQLVFLPCIHPKSSSLEKRWITRGNGKFGSTGRN